MRARFLGVSLALGLAASSSVALAAPHVPARSSTGVRAESLGSPNAGHLVGGVVLEASKCLRLIGANRWGLPELVSLVQRSCARVAEKHPGERMTVGDLSQKGGGDISGHHSHESGRDVDIGFYLVDRHGREVFAPRFATIDAEGRAHGLPGARFDDAANWDFVEALVTDPRARVIQIFVAKPIRARLLAEAARRGVPAHVRDRAASLMLQPTRGLPHDNHFHVRIACPKGSPNCIDYATKDHGKTKRGAMAKRSGKPKLKQRTGTRPRGRAT
jgi:penicillin-insensitive murein DD-endopeptidase